MKNNEQLNKINFFVFIGALLLTVIFAIVSVTLIHNQSTADMKTIAIFGLIFTLVASVSTGLWAFMKFDSIKGDTLKIAILAVSALALVILLAGFSYEIDVFNNPQSHYTENVKSIFDGLYGTGIALGLVTGGLITYSMVK